MIRVVDVRGLRTPGQRAAVCYCGRQFAGWPRSVWGNHERLPCPDEFRSSLMSLPPAVLGAMLDELWKACDHGAKPLGCWCVSWTAGDGPTPPCHAAVWAELLRERFVTGREVRVA